MRLQQGETTITPRDKTKPNTTKKQACILHFEIHITKSTQKTKPRFGRLLGPPAWKQIGPPLVEREGMDK